MKARWYTSGLLLLLLMHPSAAESPSGSDSGGFDNSAGEQSAKEQLEATVQKKGQLFGDKALTLFQQKFIKIGDPVFGQSPWVISNYPTPSNPSAMDELPRVRVTTEFSSGTPTIRSKVPVSDPSTLKFDSTGFAAIDPSAATGQPQTAYLGVDQGFPSDFLSNPNSKVDSAQVTVAPVRFLAFVADPNNPNLVSSMIVQVGNVTAAVPIDPPPPPASPCTLRADKTTASNVNGEKVTFTLEASSVITSATISNNAISVPLTQSATDPSRLIGTIDLPAPGPSELTNLVQETCSPTTSPEFSNGTWTVSARVSGPVNSDAWSVSCTTTVNVRVRKPPPPACSISLQTKNTPPMPTTRAEPGESVTATLFVTGSPVDSAIFNGSSVSPNSSYCSPGSTSIDVIKQDTDLGAPPDLITASVTGPGGTTTCQATLELNPPDPRCQLTHNVGNSCLGLCSDINTGQFTLACSNQVKNVSLQICSSEPVGCQSARSLPFAKEPDGFTRSRFPFTKTTNTLEEIRVVVSNKWNRSATLNSYLGWCQSSPTCSLTASPKNAGTYVQIKSVNSDYCLDNASLSTGTGFTQQACLSSANFKLFTVSAAENIYRIQNVDSGFCLEIADNSMVNGGLVKQYPCQEGKLSQEFLLVAVDAISYKIIARVSNKVLDVQGISTSPGAVVWQWDDWGGNNQKWRIISPTSLKPGDLVNLTVSNIQGCFDRNQVRIANTPVTLSPSGTATLDFTKLLTTEETIQATIGAPGGLTGTCATSVLGAPPPSCTLTSNKPCVDISESADLTLNCTNATDAYIAGQKIPLDPNGRGTYSYLRTQCSFDTISAVGNGPGGQALASVGLPLCAQAPQCTLTKDTDRPGLGENFNVVLDCGSSRVTEATINNVAVNLVGGRATAALSCDSRDTFEVLANVKNTACFSVDYQQPVTCQVNTCKWNFRYPPQNVVVSTIPGNNRNSQGVSGWTDTGINVVGDSLIRIFGAQGSVDLNGPAAGGATTPEGFDCSTSACNLYKEESDYPIGALLGKIGSDGEPFLVGLSDLRGVYDEEGGRLYFRVNESTLSSVDNTGSFSVRVQGEFLRDVIKPANSFSNLLYDTDAGRVYQKVAVSVPGNAIDWVDTNLTIDDSSFLSITATGFIDTNGNAAEGRVYPNGMACTTATCRNCRLNSSFNRGALIGKIGAAGAPFLISKGIEIPVVWGGRLYLSANNTACASSASSSAFTVSVGIQPSTTTIYGYSIPGNAAVAATWTDTGLDVTNDIYVDFFASGTVDLNGSAAGQAYGPAGVAGACPTCPVPGFNKGALLGRIGPSGTVFSVGTTRRNVRSGAGGRLSFLVNDPNRADNTGSFTVMVYAKGQSDRFKNLNMNPNVAGSGSIIFTDALHSDAIVTYQRDENGDYDFAGIYARDFDDSYDVLVSRSDFAYVSRSRNGVRYFWSRDKTPASSQSLLLQTVEAVPYATQNGLLGYFQALNSVQVESRILPHCTRNSTCVGYYGKPYADAWWFQIGPKDSPDCEIEKVFIREGGCFTADTEIQMANGQSKKVSELRENQFIWNPHYQTGIRIKKIVKGPEKKPLYWVRVGEKSLTVTEDHPFLTETGWVQAQALKPGQRLFGEGEGKTVSEVTKLKYKGPEDVWNFELETDEPLGHVILANGIPTGDLTTQTRIKKGPQSVP